MISKPKSFLTLTGRRPEERGADRDELSRRRQGLEHDQIGSCQSGLMIVKHFWGKILPRTNTSPYSGQSSVTWCTIPFTKQFDDFPSLNSLYLDIILIFLYLQMYFWGGFAVWLGGN
jgi:hypothetical protein